MLKLFLILEKKSLIFQSLFFFDMEAKYKAKHGKGLKILSPKQMLQRLAIVLLEVKAGNTSKNLLN